ncbi:gamma-glutamylcyclotransferase [Sutcliffiella rhizosphaerae]|uniref:Gamma-glutamylcyclotransferase YkqA n=1 Tax=Sutcliffiella rhizosphaerae TaxID=2880967 RepID=A0ABM8YKM6_9BACI|nr:gamma-glutamylcyclotransferase [Sutcliffiella rhizosphaerae]CAG9620361.1 Putative gamma-glutamylcyclotransferase YkqA [Sutcliffiella rhizosphaerae]
MKVFVYGTLRNGEKNARILKHARLLAEQSWTDDGSLYDTGYGYPAFAADKSGTVYGELYEVNEEELVKLDLLEEYEQGRVNNLYERVTQTIHTDKGSISAYVYIGRKDLFKRRIPTGDWKEYIMIKEMQTVRYFAYGSCMDLKRINEAGVGGYFRKIVGVGVLDNYSLKFTRKSPTDNLGRADIVEDGNGAVEGKVYEIPVSVVEKYLYVREGVPFAYRPTFVSISMNGQHIVALTFVVKNKDPETPPPIEYEVEIFRGAEGFLSEDYLQKVKKQIDVLRNHEPLGI